MLLQLKHFIRAIITGNYLPCYVYSHSPMIVFAYDSDFTGNAEDFCRHFRKYSKVYLFLQLGWQHETDNMALPFAEKLKKIQSECPQLNITVLANSPAEETKLKNSGIHTVFCHQNAFVNEHKYLIRPNVKKCYDAIYVARIAPFKRHSLARDITSLSLIGDYHKREKPYADEVLAILSHAARLENVPGSAMSEYIAKAKCGLCLSAEEGAMFVSVEYLLCGLPIVNTPNMGGRDFLFPDFAVKTVDADPAAIAAAVKAFVDNPIDPWLIRNATIQKMRGFRTVLQQLVADVYRVNQRPVIPENIVFPHKLGLRCTKMPWVNFFHGLKRGN